MSLYFVVVFPQASGSCRHMMLEISALQARVAHLEDEKHSLEEKLCLKFKEHYDHVVRQLVSTCVQLKVRGSSLNLCAWLDLAKWFIFIFLPSLFYNHCDPGQTRRASPADGAGCLCAGQHRQRRRSGETRADQEQVQLHQRQLGSHSHTVKGTGDTRGHKMLV